MATIQVKEEDINRHELNIVVEPKDKYIRVTVTSEYTICISEPPYATAEIAKMMVCNLSKITLPNSNENNWNSPNSCTIVSNNMNSVSNTWYTSTQMSGGSDLRGKTYKRRHQRYTYKK
jgi:hypothetical protein